MNRGAWRATVHGVTKSQTRLTERLLHTHTHTHTHTRIEVVTLAFLLLICGSLPLFLWIQVTIWCPFLPPV